MVAQKEQNKTKRFVAEQTKWIPPGGMTFLPPLESCPNRPFPLQWRVEGKRKTRNFETEAKRTDFAKALAGSVAKIGPEAYRLDPSEARDWRAFRADIGDASLSEVARCWLRYGAASATITVDKAVEQYMQAKKAEGVAEASLAHYRPIFKRLSAVLGAKPAGAVTRDDVTAWVARLKMADASRRSHAKRLQSFFSWLKTSRLVPENPCDGLRPVKVTSKPVEILTVDQAILLFSKNSEQSKELLGRLALEAFAGLRFSSAQRIVPEDIKFEAGGITLPADDIKTRRREFIKKLPDNLWAWLRFAKPEAWGMSGRQYLEAKSDAFTRANIPHPRNCLRHSFASYHVAVHGEVGKTATILCNSEAVCREHYVGVATEAEGIAYFQILP